jgi:hypothetical protein
VSLRRTTRRSSAPGAFATILARLVVARVASAMLLAGSIAGCGSVRPIPSWNEARRPSLTSFLDIHFGAQLVEVQERYPMGAVETSPYGAEAYRIERLRSEQLHYDTVIYEFTVHTGMQLAIATFAPDSTGGVFDELSKALGAPTAQKQLGASGTDGVEATWELPHGERVTFDGPNRRIVMLGPAGSPLKQDIAIRESNGAL